MHASAFTSRGRYGGGRGVHWGSFLSTFVEHFNEEAVVEEVVAFFASKSLGSAARSIAQAVEKVCNPEYSILELQFLWCSFQFPFLPSSHLCCLLLSNVTGPGPCRLAGCNGSSCIDSLLDSKLCYCKRPPREGKTLRQAVFHWEHPPSFFSVTFYCPLSNNTATPSSPSCPTLNCATT